MYQIDYEHPVHVHFCGIGGISMSGLASVLMKEGFTVSGSDSRKSGLTALLSGKGAVISFPQKKENITDDIDVFVYSAAIHPDNPEFQEASSRQIPMLTRAQLLGEIMENYSNSVAVAGTHGKTTTTSMLSCILLQADLDPTISVGGILQEIGGNIRLGSSSNFITEACEYTNSFLSLYPKIGLVLNVDADHLDFFKDLDDIRHSFHLFAKNIRKDGTLIISAQVPRLDEITKGIDADVVTFGEEGADYYPSGITFDRFGLGSFTVYHKDQELGRFSLRVPGIHNIWNAVCAIAAADLMGVSMEDCKEGLLAFHGADRRFQIRGTLACGATVIDDYAHHPTEIRATLEAAANYPHKKVWCVFQPHTYTRTKALLPDFAKALTLADEVVLAPIYAARETDDLGISSDTLRGLIEELGTKAHYFLTFEEIENFLASHVAGGDLLITMGAGDVVKVGEEMLSKGM